MRFYYRKIAIETGFYSESNGLYKLNYTSYILRNRKLEA